MFDSTCKHNFHMGSRFQCLLCQKEKEKSLRNQLAAAQADARALAQAIHNWSAGDDETMAIVDDALLNLLETVGAKYLEGEL